jgi:hypothetical protein
MFLYPVYLKIKERLGNDVPVFFYIGQYLPGKDNTSYRVPAIYIEMPKDVNINFYPRKLQSAKQAIIKIHYTSYAPFKNQTNLVQETAIAEHENKLMEIDRLLNTWNAKHATKNITEQLITDGGSFLKFQHMALISVLNYKTQIYSRHLQ